MRRRLSAAGVRVPQGVGVVEVARWVRVSRHGHQRSALVPATIGLVALVGAAVAVVLTRSGDDGAAATSSSSVVSTAPVTTAASTSMPVEYVRCAVHPRRRHRRHHVDNRGSGRRAYNAFHGTSDDDRRAVDHGCAVDQDGVCVTGVGLHTG